MDGWMDVERLCGSTDIFVVLVRYGVELATSVGEGFVLVFHCHRSSLNNVSACIHNELFC